MDHLTFYLMILLVCMHALWSKSKFAFVHEPEH